MDVSGVDLLAVLVAGVAGFAFGSVWYMTLSRPWLAAVGKTKEQLRTESSPTVFVLAAVAQLVMAYVLARVVAWHGEPTAGSGLLVGLVVWVGFVATTLVVNHGFQGARRSLTLIDGGHWLGVLLIQGLVIGLLGH